MCIEDNPDKIAQKKRMFGKRKKQRKNTKGRKVESYRYNVIKGPMISHIKSYILR